MRYLHLASVPLFVAACSSARPTRARPLRTAARTMRASTLPSSGSSSGASSSGASSGSSSGEGVDAGGDSAASNDSATGFAADSSSDSSRSGASGSAGRRLRRGPDHGPQRQGLLRLRVQREEPRRRDAECAMEDHPAGRRRRRPGGHGDRRGGTYDGPIFGWDSAPCAGDALCVVAGTAANPVLFEADPAAAPGRSSSPRKNAKNATGFDLEPGCNYVDIVGFTVTNAGTGRHRGRLHHQGGNRDLGLHRQPHPRQHGGRRERDRRHLRGHVDRRRRRRQHDRRTSREAGRPGTGCTSRGAASACRCCDNLLHDNAYVGLHVNGDVSEGLPGVVKNLLVAGNLIYKNGQNGINGDGIESSTIENNVIYDNARNGIELYQIDAYGGSTGERDRQQHDRPVDGRRQLRDRDRACASTTTRARSRRRRAAAPPPPTRARATSRSTTCSSERTTGERLAGLQRPTCRSRTNITAPSSTLFVDAAAGNYQLAPGGRRHRDRDRDRSAGPPRRRCRPGRTTPARSRSPTERRLRQVGRAKPDTGKPDADRSRNGALGSPPDRSPASKRRGWRRRYSRALAGAKQTSAEGRASCCVEVQPTTHATMPIVRWT